MDMRPAIIRLPGPLLLSVLALAGCAAAQSPVAPAGPAAATAHSDATVKSTAAQTQSPKQRAEADAAAILAAFVVPPSAR